jgi:peptidoglycan/xylan/chitin deacetylase (PgdA/CDA1 family)
MNRCLACFFCVSVLAALSAAQGASPKVSVTRWPQDRAAAISLTFDDGINTDLDHAAPILKKHHLNGTFFVTTAMGPWEKRKQEWIALARDGNEIANHTVHHPCLLPEITPHSQDYTPAMMEAEIRDAADEIAKTTNSHRGITFAYPCGNMSFGKPEDEVKNAALYMRYVSEHSFAARGVGLGPQSPDELNVLDVPDLGPTADKGFPDLLKMAEPAFAGHNWGVFCFHGVGGDWLSITPEALDQLAAYLEEHSEYWIATFGDVIRYIQERKAASIEIKESKPDSLSVALSWPMDKQIYDVPLTLKVEVPGQWAAAQAKADGKQLITRMVKQRNGTTILVDVPAQTTFVAITKAAP